MLFFISRNLTLKVTFYLLKPMVFLSWDLLYKCPGFIGLISYSLYFYLWEHSPLKEAPGTAHCRGLGSSLGFVLCLLSGLNLSWALRIVPHLPGSGRGSRGQGALRASGPSRSPGATQESRQACKHSHTSLPGPASSPPACLCLSWGAWP